MCLLSSHAYLISLELSTMDAYAFQDFLNLIYETNVVHRASELGMCEMTRAFCHALSTRLALEVAVNGSKTRVGKAICFRLACFVDGLWEFDFTDRKLVLWVSR